MCRDAGRNDRLKKSYIDLGVKTPFLQHLWKKSCLPEQNKFLR
jgi:hypothetical protein